MPDRVQIVVPGDDPLQIAGSPQLARLQPYGQVTLHRDRPATLEEKVRRARDAEVILNSRGAVSWPAEAIEQLPKLRMIAVCGIGTNAVDLEAAARRGVTVCNLPGRTAPLVAEHLIALLLALAKRVAFQTAEMKAGRWTRCDNVYLRGKTLGVVGAGSIGAAASRLGRALGMEVVAWTLHPSEERAARLGVRFVDLETLLRTSDAVALCVKLSDTTRGLIGREQLALMQKGALLVNVARGAIVETDALVEALESGHLGGAALDVFDPEPPPEGHPLLSCQQVVFTPHSADQTPEGIELLNEGIVDNIVAFLEGDPQNVVVP